MDCPFIFMEGGIFNGVVSDIITTVVTFVILVVEKIIANPLEVGFSLLFLMLLYGLFKAFNGFGFNCVKEGNSTKWEIWLDNRKEGKKKEPDNNP